MVPLGRDLVTYSARSAELLKMLMHWAALRNRDDLWEPYAKSLATVKSATSLPGGYHGCGMYAEALRLAAVGP